MKTTTTSTTPLQLFTRPLDRAALQGAAKALADDAAAALAKADVSLADVDTFVRSANDGGRRAAFDEMMKQAVPADTAVDVGALATSTTAAASSSPMFAYFSKPPAPPADGIAAAVDGVPVAVPADGSVVKVHVYAGIGGTAHVTVAGKDRDLFTINGAKFEKGYATSRETPANFPANGTLPPDMDYAYRKRDGQFTVAGLPPGWSTIEIRRLGRVLAEGEMEAVATRWGQKAEVERSVNVRGGEGIVVDFAFDRPWYDNTSFQSVPASLEVSFQPFPDGDPQVIATCDSRDTKRLQTFGNRLEDAHTHFYGNHVAHDADEDGTFRLRLRSDTANATKLRYRVETRV